MWNVAYEFLRSRRAFKGNIVLMVPNARYLDSELERHYMLKRKGSSSPKLDKAECPSDDKALNDDARPKVRSAVLALLDLSSEPSSIMSTAQLSLTWKSPDQTSVS